MSVNSIQGCPNQVVVYKNPNAARNKGFVAGAVAVPVTLGAAGVTYAVANQMKSPTAQKVATTMQKTGNTICDIMEKLGNKMQGGLVKVLEKAKTVAAKNPKIGQALLPLLAFGAVGAVIGAIVGHAKKN